MQSVYHSLSREIHQSCMPRIMPEHQRKYKTLLMQCTTAFGRWETCVPKQTVQQLLPHTATGLLRSNSTDADKSHDLISTHASKLTKPFLTPSTCRKLTERTVQQLFSRKATGLLRSNSTNTNPSRDLISTPAGKSTQLFLTSAC